MSAEQQPEDCFVIEPAPRPAVPVQGGGWFPVRRIFCVARNYAAHAREMGADPSREPPFFFTKPGDAVLAVKAGAHGRFPYPPATREVHHEVELVVALGSGGAALTPEQARPCIWGYAVGLDMTRRDLQAEAKTAGRPWDVAKGFDASAPVSEIAPAAGRVLERGAIRLEVNGVPRQSGELADMMWSVPEVIAFLSRYFRLQAGDLVFTGTPDGVAAVQVGDHLHASIDDVGALSVEVVAD